VNTKADFSKVNKMKRRKMMLMVEVKRKMMMRDYCAFCCLYF